MELDELKTLWFANDAKLEKKIKLNEQNVELILAQKVASNMTTLHSQRIVECVFHVIAIGLLSVFLIQNTGQFPYVVSAIMLLIMYSILFFSAFKQISLINGIDFNQDLVTMQSSLASLQTHIVSYARLTVLFIPAFLAFPVVITEVIKDYDINMWSGFDIIRQSNGAWWKVQIIASLILIPIGIWFYKEVSFKNLDKKWVKDFIQKATGNRVTKSLEFLKELQDLKHNSN